MVNISQGQDTIIESIRDLIGAVRTTQEAQLVREAASPIKLLTHL
jgi:hypothetical protein